MPDWTDPNLLLIIIAVLIVALIITVQQIRIRAERRFEQWRARELESAKQELNRALAAEYEVKMLQWRGTYEANIRADAITRSSAVIRGRVSEHLARPTSASPTILATPASLAAQSTLSYSMAQKMATFARLCFSKSKPAIRHLLISNNVKSGT
jgi:Holliday junction resolvase-like endonuclease